MKRSNQGALLMTVMISLAIVGLIAGSVASLINFQRKAGIRQQLKLHSANAAEAAIDYAYAYVTNDANQNGLDASNYIPPSSGSPKAFTFPDDALNFLRNKNGLPATPGGSDPIDFTDIKVTIMPRPASQTRIYKDPTTTPDTDPTRGQWVYQETITLVSAVTAKQGGITATSYARKDINYNITNLFQHAVFFQGQLHLHRGFKVMGSVHTNGNLILNAHDGDHAIYNGFVAAGHRFYRGSCITGDQSGNSGTNAFGLVPELVNGDLDPAKFNTKASGAGDGTTYNPLSDGDIPIYIDTPSAGKFLYKYVNKTTDSRLATTATPTGWIDAAKTFKGYLQDMSQDVPIINPIGSSGYNMNTDGSANNSPYFLIEPLLPKDNILRTGTVTEPSQKTNYRYNLSANASLVLRVEYQARDSGGNLPAIGLDLNTADPNNNATWYKPTSDYGKVASGAKYAALPLSLDPSRYVVRAYKKPASMPRANDPTDRVAIPFPTDVIGRADYRRVENSTVNGGSYNYAAGVAPQSIDVLGTELKITTAAANADVPIPRANTGIALTNLQVRYESWHRYHIENYYAVNSPPTYSTATTGDNTCLANIGTPIALWSAANHPAIPSSAVQEGAFPLYGLHDSRLGRGVHLLTLDISRLREIMEEPLANVKAKYGPEADAFRQAFNNGSSEWNGIVYVEFPTSAKLVYDPANPAASVNPAPSTSVYSKNATQPWNPDWNDPAASNLGSYLDTYVFQYATTEETRYPLRASDSTTIKRKDKTVPIAPEFRRYPATVDSSTITDPANAIMALQVINAKRLPRVNTSKFDATANNLLTSGFTVATNAPLYLIGSWNSDGNYATGTNVTSTDPTKYATTDTGTATSANNPEIPSAIFCDMFTVLSPGWATQTKYLNEPSSVQTLTRRQNSFPGWGSDSNTYRAVEWQNSTERIEVSACIATGDFPIFEFFPHALEDFYKTNGTACTPLVVKGAMVSMFTSEVQHIKQAYGRDANKDIQVYYAAHGANNFPSPRFHQFLVNGEFPPGTPQALVPSQSNFQVISKGAKSPDDYVERAGF
jgi:type II secretory pathway pseudopilin PulG